MVCFIAIILFMALCALFCFACLWVGADYDAANERQRQAWLAESAAPKSEKDVSVDKCSPK